MPKKQSAKYVDGFVFVVPKKHVVEYKKMARKAGNIWMKYGALDYKECIGNDLRVKSHEGIKPLSFTKLMKVKPTETVWFSYITYKNKRHRDQVNKKVMADPVMNDPKEWPKEMPFDMKQMAYGGFAVEVSG